MDSDSRFEVVSERASEDMSFLGDRFYDFNADASGFRNGVVLGVFVRDDDGETIAGTHGHLTNPEGLVEIFLNEFTDEGDLVFDLFAGFETTLIAERMRR